MAGITSERRCGWITDTTGDRIPPVRRANLRRSRSVQRHRLQYAETLLGEPIWPPMPFGPFPTAPPVTGAAA